MLSPLRDKDFMRNSHIRPQLPAVLACVIGGAPIAWTLLAWTLIGWTAIAWTMLAGRPLAAAQNTGSIEGNVILTETGEPLHGAAVLLIELGRTTTSDDEGHYRFDSVPPGRYSLLAHLDSIFTEDTKAVTVAPGIVSTLNFSLELAAVKYQVNVTARGEQQTAFESFQSVESLDSYDLAESVAPSLGEVLGNKPGSGISKRSFGPGSSRPMIRGFDGDRVLIMQDGIRTGTLSSQSGDHGELINAATLDRLEVVKGPATLLYGSSALGGVVNAVSRHHAVHEHPHQGARGFVYSSAGSANALAGAGTGFEYGRGKWMIWGGGSGQRTGDYPTPIGPVESSRTRSFNGQLGLGWYGDKTFVSAGFKADDGIYGVPFAAQFEEGEQDAAPIAAAEGEERIQIEAQRQAFDVTWGLRKIGPAIESFRLSLNATQWAHDEVEVAAGARTVGTQFDQNQYICRGVFEQEKRGPLTGRFGFWGLRREYDVAGEEALSPPVDQDAAAVFGLQELEFENFKLQFGGRLERNSYDPIGLPKRSFTGGSAAAGVHADVWKGGVVVVNYTRSFRAPALEELYNNGPHIGSLSFEVGDPTLVPETGNGVELSLRQQSSNVQGELNLFYYGFSNFVFPFATGEIRSKLPVIEFTQRDARFAGGEANLGLRLHRDVWLNLGMDFVDAQETAFRTPLPRIPPLRGKLGFDWRRGGLSVKPEVILASSQQQTFTTESRTPGYTVVNLKASYTIARQHLAHQLSCNIFNIGDRLYRNHSSFIKDLAPEIGRGVRFTYMVRFF